MKKISRFILCLLIALTLGLMSVPASAQSDLETINQQLEKAMSRETPLTEEDIRLYLANVDPIYRLRFEPERLPDTVKAINGWTENRFAYVTTKISVGMSILLRADDPRNAAVPVFARPSQQELALLRRYQEDLTRAIEGVQSRYSAPANPGG